MKVDRQAILHVARLAQLELDESQIKHYESQLKKILSYIAKLEELSDEKQLQPQQSPDMVKGCEREDIVFPKNVIEQALSLIHI